MTAHVDAHAPKPAACRRRSRRSGRPGPGGCGPAHGLLVFFWRVPTEVVGRGVLIVPGGATVMDARVSGQILRIPVRVGERVRRGQPLLELYLPILDQELRRQERDLR